METDSPQGGVKQSPKKRLAPPSIPTQKTPGAIELVLDIVSTCDALVENYQPGQLAKMGLPREKLEAAVYRAGASVMRGRRKGVMMSFRPQGSAILDAAQREIDSRLLPALR